MTIQHITVRNMNSPRTGNPVNNQFEIFTPEGVYFQSYKTIIAYRDNSGQVFLDTDSYNYSRTTSKYRNAFLHTDTKTVEQNIKDGRYILTNLNK